MNTNDINRQAFGWGLFETENGLQIQKDDESGRFDSDDEALAYVAELARDGPAVFSAALAYHYAAQAGLQIDSAGVIDAAYAVPENWDAASATRLSKALDNL